MSYEKLDTKPSMTGSPLDPTLMMLGETTREIAEGILSGRPFRASLREMSLISIGLTLKELSPSFSLSLPVSLGTWNSDGRVDVESGDISFSTIPSDGM
jgi:hypothetical protein